MNITQQFRSAVEHYQKGNFQQAENICREIIKIQPKNIDAIRLLAMLYYQFQEYDFSADYNKKVLQLDPNDFFAFSLLGNIFYAKGNLKEAVTYFQKAIELNPSLADAHYNLGIVLEKQNKIEEAIISYQKALDINPSLADVYNNLGNALYKKGRVDEAILYLKKALELNPNYILAFHNLGMVYKSKNHFDEAIAFFQKAIELNPSFADAYCNLAISMKEKGQIDDAIIYLQKAIEFNPSFADAYYTLAIILKEKDRDDEAVTLFKKAIELNPSFADAYCNLAIIFEERGMFDEALFYYRRALQIAPDDAEVHWNMSLALLSSGNFEQGWRKYEWRFEVKDFKQRSYPIPRWDGFYLKERNLFIHAEQGIGEEIMFSSCLPDVIHQTDHCIVECDRRLAPLFARSFPKAYIIGHIHSYGDLPKDIPSIDMRTAIGSLPLFLRPNLASFPQYNTYFIPDSLKVVLWRSRFEALGKGLKIGISWRGGGKASDRLLRSTVIEQWSALFSVPGIHFINLQYGDCSVELGVAAENLGVTIHDWDDADPLKDLDGFAAQIAALDLVISVDNATVHMAGALGVPVWILLPLTCDWRWMRDFEDTPWYKTVRLIRQSKSGDWDGVFERVTSDLRQYISTDVTPEIKYSYKSYIKAEATVQPILPIQSLSSERTYRCAVITPIGPGHEHLYRECLASIEKSFAEKKGSFSEIIPIRIDDLDGRLGRSRARNIGIKKAAEYNVEWIFFLDADDVMTPAAFEYVSPYLEYYDGIWGCIWTIEKGESMPKERPHQLPFLYNVEDILSCDPFVTLQIGHFVKTQVALEMFFDESLDTGEDFDYYLRVWEKYRCIKIPLPLFYNRRGIHSQGPRSATGSEWRQQVEDIINKRYPSRLGNFI